MSWDTLTKKCPDQGAAMGSLCCQNTYRCFDGRSASAHKAELSSALHHQRRAHRRYVLTFLDAGVAADHFMHPDIVFSPFHSIATPSQGTRKERGVTWRRYRKLTNHSLRLRCHATGCRPACSNWRSDYGRSRQKRESADCNDCDDCDQQLAAGANLRGSVLFTNFLHRRINDARE